MHNLVYIVLVIYFVEVILFDICASSDGKCVFTTADDVNQPPHVITFNKDQFSCVECGPSYGIKSRFKTLYSRRAFANKEVCEYMECNGVLCSQRDQCIRAEKLPSSPNIVQICRAGRASTPEKPEESPSTNQAPIIIGFAVGGIMLAVVIAGVFLGRANRAAPNNESAATTPVSMSYSEWISTYSVGGRGSKLSNMRVQESGSLADADDPQGLAVYSIVYGDDDAASDQQLHGYDNDRTVIEVDEMGVTEDLYDVPYQQTTDNFVEYIAEPMYDGQDTVMIECSDNFLRYQPTDALREDTDHNTFSNPLHVFEMKENVVSFQSGENNAVYVKQRDSWSDESSLGDEDTSFRTPLNRNSPSQQKNNSPIFSSLNESCDYPPVNFNYENMKHVFVDVHRSMTCSCEELRRSQKIAEDEEPLMRRNAALKPSSFRVFKDGGRNYNCLLSKPSNGYKSSLTPLCGRTKRRFSF